MDCLRRDLDARPSAGQLFDRLDELASIAGVGTVRFR
jgi:hypothetical protein